MIKYVGGKFQQYHYFDKNGVEITEGCKIKFPNGKIEVIYLTTNGKLGTDATNPAWIESGRAGCCEYGIYPLTREDTEEVEVVND